jgi:hypothetical protein
MKFSVLGVLALSAFLSVAAHADDCIDQICVGSTVIDQNDSIGTVSAVSANEIDYTVSGYGNSSAPPQDLSPQVKANGPFTAGILVIDQNDSIGKVDLVFANGDVQYTVSGYGTTINPMNNLSPAVQTTSGRPEIYTGVTVVDQNDSIGTVNLVFANGNVQYTISGYGTAIVNISDLSALVPSYGPLVKGSVVVDQNDSIGTVDEVFKNGDVQYTIAGYGTSINLSSNLSVQVGKLGLLSAHTIVVDQNDSIGTVDLLFANGKVQYTIAGYGTSINDASNLAAQVTSYPGTPDVVTGTTVIDQNDSIGSVNLVFANGKAQYTIPSYGTSIDTIGLLSPEVKTNPNYKKGTLYASDDYLVGTANRFFKNGKIELVTNGEGNFVATQLFPQVAQLNGYTAGTSITMETGTAGNVLTVFANGTVQYTYLPVATTSDPKPTLITLSAKTLGADPQQLQTDQRMWLREYADYLSCTTRSNTNTAYCVSPSSYVDKTSDYPALKKALLALLQTDPTLLDDATRAQVVAALSK